MASEAPSAALAAGARGGDVAVSTDASRLDLDMVHGFLADSYWAAGIAGGGVGAAVVGQSLAGDAEVGQSFGRAQRDGCAAGGV